MRGNRLDILLCNGCLWCSMLLMAMAALWLTACSDDDGPVSQENQIPQVTLLFPVNGLGDQSYSDNIYEGVCRAKALIRLNRAVEFIEYVPTNEEEAETFMAHWMNQPGTARRLLMVCESSFIEWMERHSDWKSTPERQIVWLDVDGEDERYHTRYISLYGVSYMAGKAVTTMGIERSAIVLANPENAPLLEASEGFFDGQKAGGGICSPERDVYLLASHAGEGFNASDELFRLAYQLEQNGYQFVFPVCGGSSQGLYRYTRMHTEGTQEIFYTCGLDVDQQIYSRQIAFSLLKRYDQMVEDYILDWATEEPCASWLCGDLSNGYASFLVSKRYEGTTPGETYWNALQQEAMEAENQFRKKRR